MHTVESRKFWPFWGFAHQSHLPFELIPVLIISTLKTLLKTHLFYQDCLSIWRLAHCKWTTFIITCVLLSSSWLFLLSNISHPWDWWELDCHNLLSLMLLEIRQDLMVKHPNARLDRSIIIMLYQTISQQSFVDTIFVENVDGEFRLTINSTQCPISLMPGKVI